MPTGTKVGRVLDSSPSYSSEDEVELRVSENMDPRLEPADLRLRTRTGPRLWWSVGLSVLGSAAAMAAAGCLCALIYPILKGMRVSVRASARVTGWVKLEGNHVVLMDSIYFRMFYNVNTMYGN